MTDTSTVTVDVLSVRPATGNGGLIALADAEVLVDGVSLLIHGLRVSRLSDGRMGVEAPTTRNEAGRWVPAVTLPVELGRAMASAVLAVTGCEKIVM
ncbi:hypothetical protein [Magnetospirillum sp. 15-1]|uniref:hypothetical protein n=1 Tax=Magnetospirillum sp. 15-1 TaxID=1979370 RepID=UPI000BBCB156|nr:hypothetical protein [Magnetospirillum sp. 15-1]